MQVQNGIIKGIGWDPPPQSWPVASRDFGAVEFRVDGFW